MTQLSSLFTIYYLCWHVPSEIHVSIGKTDFFCHFNVKKTQVVSVELDEFWKNEYVYNLHVFNLLIKKHTSKNHFPIFPYCDKITYHIVFIILTINAMALTALTILCNHYHCLYPKHFHHPQLYMLNNNSTFFLSPVHGNLCSLFCSYEFASSRYLL